MALPNALPQISDLGSLLGSLNSDLVDIPLVNTPFTTVVNRAQMYDLTKDLAALMGNSRLYTHNLIRLQNEKGPNGEVVYGVANDWLNQIRVVGTSDEQNTITGQYIRVGLFGDLNTGYIEITFYGTGLNVLINQPGATHTAVYSVDGGAESANFIPAMNSAAIAAVRNYSPNCVVPVVGNLAAGVHTVKIRNTGVASFHLHGVEIVNSSSNIRVNPGTVWNDGKKLYNAAQAISAYNTGFESGALGTKGGRVSVYVKADGSIGKSVFPVNASQLNLTAADHTNEEVVRFLYFKEMGSGRADDYSRITNSAANKSFADESGSFALYGSNNFSTDQYGGNYNLPIEALTWNNNGTDFVTLNFIGCGLDIVMATGTASTTTGLNVSVNGTSVGTQAMPTSGFRTLKIVSGLPFGSNSVRITTNATGLFFSGIVGFIIYQPKLPTIPEGAKQVAEYKVMADFTPNTVAGIDTTGPGTMWKFSTREMNYVGGGWAAGGAVLSTSHAGGYRVGTIISGDYLEYTFFGTGIEFKTFTGGADSNNVQFALQNLSTGGALLNLTTTNFPTLLSATYGATFSPATGIASFAGASQQMGVSCYNLPLAHYKIRMTTNTGSLWQISTLNIVTPIFDYKFKSGFIQQGAVNTGSQGVGDSRKLLTNYAQKNAVQCSAANSGVSTTSTVFTPVNDMTTMIEVKTGTLLDISAQASWSCTATTAGVSFGLFLDGSLIEQTNQNQDGAQANGGNMASVNKTVPVSPGFHYVELKWLTGTGTLTSIGTMRTLKVKEQ